MGEEDEATEGKAGEISERTLVPTGGGLIIGRTEDGADTAVISAHITAVRPAN